MSRWIAILVFGLGVSVHADTYPTEVWPSNSDVLALNGTTDPETGLVWIAEGTNPQSSPSLRIQFDRLLHRLYAMVEEIAQLRVVKTDALEVGCFPGEFRLQGVDYHYAGQTDVTGADGVAFSDGDDTYYLWLDSTNALRMATDGTGWPSDTETFIPLAEVTVSSATITTIKDVRNRVRLATPWGGTGTDSTSFTLDQDNAGAGVNVEFRANRGSTAGDAALRWNESSDEWVAFADADALTFGPLVGSIFRGTQTTGTAPLAVVSTTKVTNLNADAVDGISIGTLTAAGGAAYAHSTSEIRATAAGASGDVLVSNAAAAPSWQSLATAGIQAQDADLDALAALTEADDTFIVGTGSGWAAENAATARGSIGCGTIATQDADSVTISGGSVAGITDLAVADGGTAASDADTARTNLGLAIGSDVQAWDADLDGVANSVGYGLMVRVSAGSFTQRSVAAGTGIAVTNGDGVSVNPTVARETSIVPHTSNVTMQAVAIHKVHTNEGATAKIELTLPTAAAGLDYEFVVQDADGLKIIAGADDTIRVAAGETPAAGYIECTTIGNTVRLVAINATEWIAISYVGTWTVSS